jgi:hypothetical protein
MPSAERREVQVAPSDFSMNDQGELVIRGEQVQKVLAEAGVEPGKPDAAASASNVKVGVTVSVNF